MSEIPVLEKRRFQAEVIGPILKARAEPLGREAAEQILDRAICKAAISEGKGYAKQMPVDAPPLRALLGERATLVMATEQEFEEFLEGELPDSIIKGLIKAGWEPEGRHSER